MAKKSFKTGLGSLIRDSRLENEDNNANDEYKSKNEDTDILLQKISDLNEELKLWRTGKLTTEIFNKSLKENKLSYNVKDNSFSKI